RQTVGPDAETHLDTVEADALRQLDGADLDLLLEVPVRGADPQCHPVRREELRQGKPARRGPGRPRHELPSLHVSPPDSSTPRDRGATRRSAGRPAGALNTRPGG